MKKKICMFIAMMMLMSSNCFAEYKGVEYVNIEDTRIEDMSVRSKLILTGGTTGTEVTELSSGKFSTEITCRSEFFDGCIPKVAVDGMMDGENKSKLVWSDDKYSLPNEKTNCKSVAIMQADATAGWSEKSCVIMKIEDLVNEIDAIRVYMGATEDGPRDYRVEYSMDGRNYEPIPDSDTEKYSLSQANQIENLMNIDLRKIKRTTHHVQFQDDYTEDFTWNMDLSDTIYVRIEVASDYCMDGKSGLYNSQSGEWALYDIELVAANKVFTCQTPVIKAYKTGNKTATIKWNQVPGATGYEVYVKKGKQGYKKQGEVTNAKSNTYKLTKLSSTGTYRVKLRSYTLIDGDKIYSDYSQEVVVNMEKQPLPKDLKIKRKILVNLKKTKKLKVECIGGKSTKYIDSVQYNVKNPKIATVKNGVIKGKKAGTTSVTVRVQLKSGLSRKLTAKINVKK